MLIVSVSTIPSRIHNLEPFINNILAQTCLPDKIVVNVCDNYKRFTEKIDTDILNSLCEKYNILVVNKLDVDYGPITKLLGTLKWTSNIHDIIITLDDDISYPKILIETLLAYYKKTHGHAVYGLSALNFVGTNGIVKRTRSHLRAFHILEGFGGVIYKRAMFRDDFYSYVDTSIANDYCFRSDDLIIHNYLQRNKIYRRVIFTDSLNINHIVDLKLTDNLHDLHTKSVVKYATQFLKENNIFFFDN